MKNDKTKAHKMLFWKKIPTQYKGIIDSFSFYWKAYGGASSFFASPYVHIALLFTFAVFPLWTDQSRETAWFDISLSALPNLLGFTLGGYAILLAFGDDQFRSVISVRGEDDLHSPFIAVNSTFVHFIVVQVLAIMTAVIGSAWNIKSGRFAFFGFFCFSYSILTAIAAGMAVLRLAKWFDLLKAIETSRKNKTGQGS